jgi:hypothetical protein
VDDDVDAGVGHDTEQLRLRLGVRRPVGGVVYFSIFV